MKKFHIAMKRLIVTLLLSFSLHLYAQTWKTPFESEGYVVLFDAIRTSENETVLVGHIGDTAWMVKFDEKGEYVSRTYPEYRSTTGFMGVEELDNGNYLALGCTTINSVSHISTAIIDRDLNFVKSTNYAIEDGYGHFEISGCRTMKDSDGTVVASMAIAGGQDSNTGTLWRFDQEGTMIHNRYLGRLFPYYLARFMPYQLKKTFDDQEIVMFCPCRDGFSDMLYFDASFNCLRAYQVKMNNWPLEYWYSDWYYDNGDMLSCAICHYPTDVNYLQLLLCRLTPEGEYVNQCAPVRLGDTCVYTPYYRGMAAVDANTIYVGATCHPEGSADPSYPEMFLINQDLEILGKISLEEVWESFTFVVIETGDGGCIATATARDSKKTVVMKFTRDDFNPMLSVQEVSQDQLQVRVFPNPAHDRLNIDISNIPFDEANRIRITDANGRVCIDRFIKGEGNLLTLGIEALAQGVYLYQIYDSEKELLTGRFIKD